MGTVVALRGSRERLAIDAEGVVEAELAGTEVTVLQPRIDIGADGVAQPGDALIGPGAVAIAREVGPRPTGTATGISAKAAADITVEQSVGHQRLHADVIADAEVRRRRGGPGSGSDVRHQRRADAEALHLGALVAGFALEPDDAELVSGDRVDIEAGLVFDVIAVVVGRGVVEDHIEIGAAGERHPAFHTGIRPIRRRISGAGQDGRGGRCQQIVSHRHVSLLACEPLLATAVGAPNLAPG